MKIKKIVLILLFLIIGLNRETMNCYIIAFIILLLSFLAYTIKIIKIQYDRKYDFIPISFIFIWIYGLIYGFLNKNEPSYIIANFAGMSCYTLYYVFINLNISKRSLVQLLFYSCISTSCIAIVYFISSLLKLDISYFSSILGGFRGGSSTGQIRVYFSGISVSFSVWLVSFIYILMNKREKHILCYQTDKKNITIIVLFILSTFSLYFITASKGYMLAGIFYVLIVPLLFLYKKTSLKKISKKLFLYIILIFIFLLILIQSGYIIIVNVIFDENDGANILRYQQLFYLLNDLRFMGNGLGSVIYGYSRNTEKPYGFELLYINLIHKFGIFSIILFINWAFIIFQCCKNIYKRYNTVNSLFALGCMGYLFPSVGNPIAMNPMCVTLNCISIYLLRKDDRKYDL
jgi:hypothetical protein